MKNVKFISFIAILLFFLIIIPQSFALENTTSIADNNILINEDTSNSNNNQNTILKDASNEDKSQNTQSTSEDNISTNNYYSNLQQESNNDESVSNSYTTLNEDIIKNNSKKYLNNGEYILLKDNYYTNIELEGESVENTIINGNGHRLYINGNLTLKNITLKNIKIINNHTLTLYASNTIFKECNDINGYGGAININSGTIKIYNSTFEDNNARYGGAIYAIKSNLECYNSIFKNNKATMLGGSITSIRSENLQINNTQFLNNNAGFEGGAIYSFYGNSIITNSIFNNNKANAGGALFIDNNTQTTITDNEFKNNHAQDIAGAIYALSNLESTINNNIYTNNLAKTDNNLLETNIPYLFISNGDYTPYVINNTHYTGPLPSYYDLRDYGYVTPVKDQGDGGNCWAFASLAVLESCILKAFNITYDFSEENMKNLIAKYSDYGWNYEPNDGGRPGMDIGYLVSWLGPINDEDDIYSETNDLSLILNSVLHIQNIVYLDRTNATDNDAIKQAILDYGAVSTVMNYNRTYLKNGKNYYYYSDEDFVDHVVVIVGWDDNYSKDNFKGNPAGDGAWIVKNSWGTKWGENGYFYISYYDTRLAWPDSSFKAYTFILNDTIKFDKNYQYDIPGKTDYFLNTTNTVWYKNVFNATDNEYLAAVSTFFNTDTNYTISIYVNNALKLIQNGFTKGGYYTINLNEFIQLNIGDIFEVVFKITVDGDVGFPIAEKISYSTYNYNKNISFLSYDGETWRDMYELTWSYPDHTYYSQVACIKAFTIFKPIDTNIKLSIINGTNSIQAKITDSYGYPIKGGTVTFKVNGKTTSVKVNNGIAIFNPYGNPNEYNVQAVFNAIGHKSSEDNIKIKIVQTPVKISINIPNEYNPIEITAKITDQYNYPIYCGNVTFTLDNTNITINVIDGIAKLNYSFKNLGLNKIIAKFNSIYQYNSSYASSEVNIKTTIISNNAIKTLNSQYHFKLLDQYGNPLKNQKITIGTDTIQTDNDGTATLNIKLNPGIHQITIINPINNEIKTQTITVLERISENNDLNLEYGVEGEYKVKVLDDNGNIAKGVPVTFTLNNQKYTEITNNNGYASIKINLNPNTYTITAEYKGYKVSNIIIVKSQKGQEIKHKNVKVSLTLKTIKTIKKSAKKLVLTATLKLNGKKAKNKQLTFIVNNKKYFVKTNNKGVAKLNFKKSKLKKILKKTKAGKKIKYQIKYGKNKITKYIKVKK